MKFVLSAFVIWSVNFKVIPLVYTVDYLRKCKNVNVQLWSNFNFIFMIHAFLLYVYSCLHIKYYFFNTIIM